jgi:hypothetical protein
MYTIADLKEVRPGVLKLDGRDFYVVTAETEKCDTCDGAGKVSSKPATGRQTTRKCHCCKGTGQCDPRCNLARQHRHVGRHIQSFAISMEMILDRLNGPHGSFHQELGVPCFISLKS